MFLFLLSSFKISFVWTFLINICNNQAVSKMLKSDDFFFFMKANFCWAGKVFQILPLGGGNIDNSLLSRLDPCEVEEIYNEVWHH